MHREKTDTSTSPDQFDPPPIFNTWNQVYSFVLILHIIIIIFFYWFTKSFS